MSAVKKSDLRYGDFEPAPSNPGQTRSFGYVIRCSRRPGFDTYSAMYTGRQNPLAVGKKFLSRGWNVGRRRDLDVCPRCEMQEPMKHIKPQAQFNRFSTPDLSASGPTQASTPAVLDKPLPLPPPPYSPPAAVPPSPPKKESRMLGFGRNKLNTSQTIDLYEKLRGVCHKGDDGFAVYQDGYSDERIVAELGSDFTKANVRGMRAQRFGKLGRGSRTSITRRKRPSPWRSRISRRRSKLSLFRSRPCRFGPRAARRTPILK